MANITETSTFDANVYLIATTDPVVGGADGVSNLQAKALANRTRYLKNMMEAAIPRFAYVGIGPGFDVSFPPAIGTPPARNYVKIPFNAVVSDDAAMWSEISHRFIAPTDGLMQIAAMTHGQVVNYLTYNMPAPWHPYLTARKNGVQALSGMFGTTTIAGHGATSVMSGFIPVDAGDYVEIYLSVEGSNETVEEWNINGGWAQALLLTSLAPSLNPGSTLTPYP